MLGVPGRDGLVCMLVLVRSFLSGLLVSVVDQWLPPHLCQNPRHKQVLAIIIYTAHGVNLCVILSITPVHLASQGYQSHLALSEALTSLNSCSLARHGPTVIMDVKCTAVMIEKWVSVESGTHIPFMLIDWL